MNRVAILLSALLILTVFDRCKNLAADTDNTQYDFEQVEKDPLQGKVYTLKNGLRVFLSVYKDEPRVQTLIAVKAGSKYDPAETTGLAHYLEHMLFKGTQEIGTVNWEKEQAVLQQISDLFEKHKAAGSDDEKKEIYAEIDRLSVEASKFAVPNEYDKMINSIGAKGTNAYTSNDRTVYMNDVPSNELERWLKVESARFRTLVLRLFHTELETVYEEFNRSQDRDGRWSFEAILKGLFPNHPYGTQSTIGVGDHLKNPSLVNIHDYFSTYYNPNNIAICLSGDLDPDKTLAMIEKHFGDWESKPIPEFSYTKDPPPSAPVVTNHYGPQEEHVYIGFSFDGANSDDATMVRLVDGLLSNSQAGLIDLNLVQKQRVLNAYASPFIRMDYTAHLLYGRPKGGQTLEELKDLLLGQVELLKQGEFEDWLIDAVIRDLKLNEMKSYEGNFSRAHAYVTAFTEGVSWDRKVSQFDRMAKITKEDVMAFVTERYQDNYAVAYKHQGGDPKRHKVEKPDITPVHVNRDTASTFFRDFDKMETDRLEPKFVDYDKDIQNSKLKSGVEFAYIENKINPTFSLSYILDMGRFHDKELALAVGYLPYLGTDKYTAEALQKEFFKLGLTFDVFAGTERSYVTLSGLEESLEEGVELFEHILANVEPDRAMYDAMVANVLKSRKNAKLNKGTILRRGMGNYARYGAHSPFTDIMAEADLKAQDIDALATKLKELTGYKHRIFYYGQRTPAEVKAVLNEYHKVPEQLTDYPEPSQYPQLEMDKDRVYFVDYDMRQAEVLFLSKVRPYDKTLTPYTAVFNEYFGAGLSSIIFQEIREQKALAYSAYSVMTTPGKKEEAHYVNAYVGTQADKMPDAIKAMQELMEDMPAVDKQFDASRESAMKKIETDWITRTQVYWNYQASLDRGLDYDIRKESYAKLKDLDLKQLGAFFDENIKGRNYTICVIGKKADVDMEFLAGLGELRELTLEEVFNY